MKETGLMFKAPLVRAILEGRKTQTRRIVKPQPAPDKRFQGWILDSTDRKRIGKALWGHGTGGLVSDIECIGSPCGKPGDRIYVRETWMDLHGTGVEHRPDPRGPLQRYAYAADTPPGSYGDEARKDYGLKWRPSSQMPKALARIWLEITGVRVETLGIISHEDALAEGVSSIEEYKALWININGAWLPETWVWVVDFRMVLN